ncbi:hypothetical protein GQ457_05G020240 [Hibiscus cannabinus]
MATSHSFSIRSAYESLVNSVWSDKSSCWKCIWALTVLQRLRFFLWLSFKERLMTNVERCRRSIGQSQICTCCQTYAETTVHVLRDCQLASEVWSTLIPPELRADFFNSNIGDSGSGTPRPIHWQHPEEGWVCLNTDGAVSTLNGFGSIGGVFRAHDWGWLLGFNKFIGFTQPLQSDLWAILTGLRLARDNGYERLLIQSDNFEVITRLNSMTATSDVNALVRSITRLRNVDWVTRFQWIPREANKLTDALVKLAANYDLPLFVVPPPRSLTIFFRFGQL